MKVRTIPILLLFVLLGSLLIFESSALTTDSDHDENTDSEEETEETSDENDDDNDDDNDGIDDDTEERYEREVEVENSAREWKIKSETKNGENKDKFEAEFKIGGGDEPEIELKYASETSSTEVELKYRVNFDELIEFNESDGIPGYSQDDDEIVSIYELDKADWNAIVYSSDLLNGATVYTASATTVDGIFRLVLKLSTGIVDLNSSIITPNAIKIDIIINDYNYQGEGTYLALQTDIKTESETQFEEQSEDEGSGFATDEEQISVTSNENAAFFSWVEHAVADNQEVGIIASTLQQSSEEDDDLEEGENHEIIFFTFDAVQPNQIVWDPKVGISIGALSTQLAGLDATFPIIAILNLLAISTIRKRQKKRTYMSQQ